MRVLGDECMKVENRRLEAESLIIWSSIDCHFNSKELSARIAVPSCESQL